MAPEVAKHFIEEYYQKLEARVAQCTGQRRKPKRRTVSFNQNDLQWQKIHSNHGNRGRHHHHRLSVDVGLLLGQTQGQSSTDVLDPTQSTINLPDQWTSTVTDDGSVGLAAVDKSPSSLKSTPPIIYDSHHGKRYETDLDVAVMQYQRRASPDRATADGTRKECSLPRPSEPIAYRDNGIMKQESLPEPSGGGTPLQQARRPLQRKNSSESKNKTVFLRNRRWSWCKKRTHSSPNLFKHSASSSLDHTHLGERVGDSPHTKLVADGWGEPL